MKGRAKSKLQASEVKFLRNSIGVTKRERLRNERIRELMKVEPLQDETQKSRLRWYDYVKQIEENRIHRRIHEMKMEGKRPRGRLRDRCLKGVEVCVKKKGEDWTKVKTEIWWQDRRRWRYLCSK